MQGKLRVAVLIVLLTLPGCGASPPSTTAEATSGGPATTSGSPTTSGLPTTSEPPTTSGPSVGTQPTDGQPLDTPSPGSTGGPTTRPPPNLPEDPLPEPELKTADEIAELMYDPAWSEQVVVSMLDLLGIGLYHPDGTPIRVGTETVSTDFFLYEPEARALIDMLQDLDEEDAWISFRDLHAALADLGYQGSAEELAQAYAESYAAEPDANVSKLVNALTFIDVDGTIPRFTAWLMFADAFVDSNASEQALASVAALGDLVAPGPRRGLGVARNRVRGRSQLNPAQAALMVHLILVVGRSGVGVSSAQTSTHEGHGLAPGTPFDFTASVRSVASQFTDPFDPTHVLIPVQTGNIEGVTVTWLPEVTLLRHGNLDFGSTRTDAGGETRARFTPKAEEANGHGVEMREWGVIKAKVSANDLITQIYGQPSLGALVSTTVMSPPMQVEMVWHELEAMHITITNHYDVAINVDFGETSQKGDDVFTGDLAQQADGTWQGTLVGTANGSGRGSFAGQGCPWSWDARQSFDVKAIEPTNPGGPWLITLTPISAATGNNGSGRCKPSRFKRDGFLLAPFNDTRITTGMGLTYAIPPDPGPDAHAGPQSTAYPITSGNLPGITIKDTSWKFEVEYLYPPHP